MNKQEEENTMRSERQEITHRDLRRSALAALAAGLTALEWSSSLTRLGRR